MTEKKPIKPVNPNPDYQDRDILVKPIVYFVIGMTILTVATVVGIALFLNRMESNMQAREADIPDSARERVLPPEPRLIVDEPMELQAYLARGRNVLDNYAILNEETGEIRLPIHVAMDVVVERGELPHWRIPRAYAPTAAEPAEESPDTEVR